MVCQTTSVAKSFHFTPSTWAASLCLGRRKAEKATVCLQSLNHFTHSITAAWLQSAVSWDRDIPTSCTLRDPLFSELQVLNNVNLLCIIRCADGDANGVFIFLFAVDTPAKKALGILAWARGAQGCS